MAVNTPMRRAVEELNQVIGQNETPRLELAEWCCSPRSRLCAEGERQKMQCQKVSYCEGYDVSKQPDVTRATAELIKRKVKRLWISLECTVWCGFADLNYPKRDEERRSILEKRRNKQHRVMKSVRKRLWRLGAPSQIARFTGNGRGGLQAGAKLRCSGLAKRCETVVQTGHHARSMDAGMA